MEFAGYLKFLLALVFVIGMIGLLAMAARRLGFGYPAAVFKGGVRVATAKERTARG